MVGEVLHVIKDLVKTWNDHCRIVTHARWDLRGRVSDRVFFMDGGGLQRVAPDEVSIIRRIREHKGILPR